jgi:uncharacterized membrane protein YfcA
VTFLLFILAGSTAQLGDGTLGMGFGITSSTLLIFLGATPVAASAAVHFAELGTTLASGASHWRAGNVDKRMVVRLGISVGIGSFAGASFLSRISTESAKGFMNVILLLLGLTLLLRFGLNLRIMPTIKGRPRSRFLVPLGLFAGFVDASGGGGWGPVTTPTMLSTLENTKPRRIVGTVSASEFVVAVCASLGFIIGTSTSGLDFAVVTGLLLGGVIMAPFAALLAGRLPHQPFGALIGGMVILTNGRSVMLNLDVPGPTRFAVLIAILVITIAGAVNAWRREHRAGIERSFFEQADQREAGE